MSCSDFLPYCKQTIEMDDIESVAKVLSSDWLTTGPEIEAFELAIANRVGSRYAVACSSGTAGLHLAAMALELDFNSRVAIPAITFMATGNSARYTGAEIDFIDVLPDTGLIDPEALQVRINNQKDSLTAVFPVHLNGQCADMEMIHQLASDQGIGIVEDAAHALGASYHCKDGTSVSVGSCYHSDMTVFSMHPAKTITMGEGGVVTTNNPKYYERLRNLRNHGITREPTSFQQSEQAFDSDGEPNPWYYEMQQLGFNYRASELHCALGLSQLGKLDRFLARRKELVSRYDKKLASLTPAVRLLSHVSGCTPAWHLYVVRIDFEHLGVERASVIRALHAIGIGTQVHYLPMNRLPYYLSRYGEQLLFNADIYYSHCLSLPLFPGMDDEDVDRVVIAVKQVLGL